MYTLGGTVGVNYWWINSERVRRPELDDRFEHWIGIPHHAYDVLLFGVEDTPRERSDEVIEALANAWRREDISRRVMFSKSTRCWHDYDPFWREKSGWESDRLHRSAVIEHEQQAGRLTAVEALEPPEQFRSA